MQIPFHTMFMHYSYEVFSYCLNFSLSNLFNPYSHGFPGGSFLVIVDTKDIKHHACHLYDTGIHWQEPLMDFPHTRRMGPSQRQLLQAKSAHVSAQHTQIFIPVVWWQVRYSSMDTVIAATQSLSSQILIHWTNNPCDLLIHQFLGSIDSCK